MAGFRLDLFLTLVGITYLFAVAQNNGTIDWLVRLAVRAVGGRIAAIPWIMFLIAALLTSVGAVSPAAVAIIAPIALGFAARYGINPLLMGLMVIHGAQGGGFSPISIYGGITNKIVQKAGLPLSEMATAFASFGVNFAVAAGLFVAFGGLRLMRQSATSAAAAAATGRRRAGHTASLRRLHGGGTGRTDLWRCRGRGGHGGAENHDARDRGLDAGGGNDAASSHQRRRPASTST